MPSEPEAGEVAAAERDDPRSLARPTDRAVVPRSGTSTGRQARDKRSVTLDAPVAQAVDRLVADGAVESFSAAINDAAARWVANQQLGRVLDELYEAEPDTRPSVEAVTAAAARLGLA